MVSLLILGLSFFKGIELAVSAKTPVGAYLVLGGSIQREIYSAEVAKRFPNLPVLISGGSRPPCIWLIFQQLHAPTLNIWIERCSKSTFDNIYFNLSTLLDWNVHRIRLVTSGTHVRRAIWLARLMLGSHGIWVDLEVVPETGVPGNQESWLKTGLDLTRGTLGAIATQFYQPPCSNMLRLDEVDITSWRQHGFKCEHQTRIEV